MVPALRQFAQVSVVFFVSHVTTVLACQMRNTPDLVPVMKAVAVKSVSKRLFLSIIHVPQSFHVWRRLMSMTPPLPLPA